MVLRIVHFNWLVNPTFQTHNPMHVTQDESTRILIEALTK